MKKALYGTTALVAAALVAGQASAASGLKLGISGFYRSAIGGEWATDNSFGTNGSGDFGRTNVAFRQEVRVNFTGSTTLDNGITVGVLVGINAGGADRAGSNVTARVNRAYMDVSGKFGQIRFGDANSAYQSMCVGDPGNVTANFGLNSPNESFSNAGRWIYGSAGARYPGTFMPTAVSGAGTCYGLETRSTKIMYFSPTFGGFNFAVSFAPTHTRGQGGSGGIGGTQPASGFQDFLSAGVNFNHDFGGITLSAGISGEWSLGGKSFDSDNAGPSTKRPSMYQAGFQVGFGGGWAVGASGQYVINYRGAGYGSVFGTAAKYDDAYMITAGGSYTVDAISVGLEGMYDNFTTSVNNSSVQYIGASLNAAYALGPGISLEGQVAWTRSQSNNSFSSFTDINAYEIDIGTAINF